MFYLNLWKVLFKGQFKSITTYRLDFYFGAVSLLFLDFPILVLIWVMFNHIPEFYSWTYYEMLFLNGVLITITSIADCFEGHTRNIGQLISNGDFDNYLTRPVKTAFLIVFSNVQIEAIISFLFGLALTIFSIVNISHLHNIAIIFLLIIHIVIGAILTSTVIFALSCISFWFIGVRGLWKIINYSYEYSHYPMNIYPKYIQSFLKWMVPVGFIGPVTIFTFLNGSITQCVKIILIEIVMCIIWMLVDAFLWKRGIRKYESAGS